MSLIPSLFVSHGSPMIALENSDTKKFLSNLSKNFASPAAIIVISAHWDTNFIEISGAKNLTTIHDFYGFPPELYQLHYPAHGNPNLAKEIQELLYESGFTAKIDESRGLDHGAWNPLLLMYPEAQIPVLQISVQSRKDALWHYKIGQALATLRQKNILILASGNLTHNLREAFSGNYLQAPDWVINFANWVEKSVKNDDVEALLDWVNQAPRALHNHPTPEHFLPFFVAMGAASDLTKAQRLYSQVDLGVLAMDAYSFE